MRKVLRRLAAHSFPRFVVVGGTGFAIDAMILKALVVFLSADPILGRLVSFSIALFCTWALNRIWSFSARRSARVLREAGRYVMVQLTGGAANLLVYSALIWLVPALRHAVLIPLAAGSAVGLGLNYAGSRLLVFRGEAETA